MKKMWKVVGFLILPLCMVLFSGCEGDEDYHENGLAQLNGTWRGTSDSGYEINMTLIQNGEVVTGEFHSGLISGRLSGFIENQEHFTFSVRNGTEVGNATSVVEDRYRIRGTLVARGVTTFFAVQKD